MCLGHGLFEGKHFFFSFFFLIFVFVCVVASGRSQVHPSPRQRQLVNYVLVFEQHTRFVRHGLAHFFWYWAFRAVWSVPFGGGKKKKLEHEFPNAVFVFLFLFCIKLTAFCICQCIGRGILQNFFFFFDLSWLRGIQKPYCKLGYIRSVL
jgi:hypothetical protein